jgi:hypothetical protein
VDRSANRLRLVQNTSNPIGPKIMVAIEHRRQSISFESSGDRTVSASPGVREAVRQMAVVFDRAGSEVDPARKQGYYRRPSLTKV